MENFLYQILYPLMDMRMPFVHLHIFLLDLFSHFHIIWICLRLSSKFWIPWNVWILVKILWDWWVCHQSIWILLWIRHLYFWKNKQGIRACVVLIFHLGLGKMSIIWKILNFYPGLKFHLGLVQPSWNFNSVYRVEIFSCNWNVILKKSLLFSWNEISTQFKELKFQPRLKIFI